MTTSNVVIIPAIAAACMILLGTPFAFKLIPRNPVFGFKTMWTLADDDIWFAANARVGRDFAVLGSLLGIHALLLWRRVYAWRFGTPPLVLVILLCLAVVLLRGFGLARRMAREKGLPHQEPRKHRGG